MVAVVLIAVEVAFDPSDDLDDDDDQVEAADSVALVKEVAAVDASTSLLDPFDDLVMGYTDSSHPVALLKPLGCSVEDHRPVERGHLLIFSVYSTLSSSEIPVDIVLSVLIEAQLSPVVGSCISLFVGDSLRWMGRQRRTSWLLLQVLQMMC